MILLSGATAKLAAVGVGVFVGGGAVGGAVASTAVEPKVETVVEYVEVEAEPEVVTETVTETVVESDPADAARIDKLESQVEACVAVIAANYEMIELGSKQANILGRYVDLSAAAIEEAVYDGVPASSTMQALIDLAGENQELTSAMGLVNDKLGPADECGDKDW